MSVIYEPRGKAREYSPLACNLYLSCMHNCKYCYAPHALQRRADAYFCRPAPRKNILQSIEKELRQHKFDKQILLSFIGDVYCETEDDNETTRDALRLFLNAGAPVAILTKGGTRCLKDLPLFRQFGRRIQVGATLTFWDKAKSLEWESGAASPQERLEVLRELKDNGVTTFASFEPVVEPAESLAVLEKSLEMDCVDIYKIGKLNNYAGLDKKIDWADFLQKSLTLVRAAGKKRYIKHDLRLAAPEIVLTSEEREADRYAVRV